MHKLNILEKVSGRNLLAMDLALREFTKHKLDVKDYQVTLVQDGDSLIVTFTDWDAAPGTRGSMGRKPGFEVALSLDLQNIIRSNFIR